ncbi:hypothetical protein GCM10007386_57900 [Pseudoduganella dura]|nr:hypothetical protein GCM10007386_57900 [Pseudoduganella dura]
MTKDASMAKTNSAARAERFIDLGWTLEHEIKAANGETYEWLLRWTHGFTPVRPTPPLHKAATV